MTSPAPLPEPSPSEAKVKYRTVDVDGVEIFYREAGARDAPSVLLLHGFPSSSHEFRHLIPALAASGFHHEPLKANWRDPSAENLARLKEILTEEGTREEFVGDLPEAEVHILDAGHWALETHTPEVIELVRNFFIRRLVGPAPPHARR